MAWASMRTQRRRLFMVTKSPTLPPIRANVGVQLRYRRQLFALVDEMNASVLYWIQAQYNKTPPALAMDARPPSKAMQKTFNELAKKWRKRFDDAAPKIADAYVRGSFKATDSAMRVALQRAGMSVKFKMNAAMRDAFNATLNENIGLIRSIPEQYLQQVEGIFTRSYSAGRDLGSMVKDLKTLYPKAARRVHFIALDQSNKANSTVENARRIQIGISEAEWMHSGGGKHPRPEHVKAGRERRRYNIREGCPIKNEKGVVEYIQPGYKPGCRCVSRSVLPAVKNATYLV